MSTQSHRMSRRTLLQTTGTLAGAMALSARSYGRVIGANDRIRIGMIGCGGMASGHLSSLLWLTEPNNIEIVAVTDVYRTRAVGFQEQIAAKGGKAAAEPEPEVKPDVAVPEVPDLETK